MQSLQNVLVLQRRENKNERRRKEKREKKRQRVGCFCSCRTTVASSILLWVGFEELPERRRCRVCVSWLGNAALLVSTGPWAGSGSGQAGLPAPQGKAVRCG